MFVPQLRLDAVFELEITLRHLEPPIRRRLHVGASFPLDFVHLAIQIAFGWEDRHKHSFQISGFHFAPVDDDDDTFSIDEAGAPLGAVARVGDTFEYCYDFGDDWNHDIEVLRVVDKPTSPLVCVDGARACPPEDCGGPPGYEVLANAMADKKHPQHAEMKKWLGRKLDPEKWDMKAVNRELAALLREVLKG